MESLLDLADALVASNAEGHPARPDFMIPEEYAAIETDQLLQLRSTAEQGQGWFAARDLPAGTLLMVAKPIVMVMDWQDDRVDQEEDEYDEEAMDEEEKEPRLNELLLIALLKRLKDEPRLWLDILTTMFPRSDSKTNLPAWVCQDDEVFFEIESLLDVLRKVPELGEQVSEIAKRLPLIIRYNILSVETCAELLSYPGPHGHSSLSGVGLYHQPSFFNHSARPNCHRWAIGDVMGFVTNRDVPAGEQVWISYIEHDVLCESAYRRNQLLTMDFEDCLPGETTDPTGNEAEGPDLPVVDSSVQNELMAMDPFERLTAIEELTLQATGAKPPEGEEQDQTEGEDMERNTSTWFQCDVQNLRILKAITLEGMGQSQEALALWEQAVEFVETRLPPLDESGVVLHAQAALCAEHMGDSDCALDHAQVALRTHHLLFGGGMARFRRRLQHDLKLSLRPTGPTASPADVLWQMTV